MSYVTVANKETKVDGRRYRPIGFNKYPLQINSTSEANMEAYFAAARAAKMPESRIWCLDVGYMPSNSLGNFRYLYYPTTGTNLLSNPTFDTNTSGWGLDAGSFSRQTDDPRTGAGYIKQVSSSGVFHNFTTTNDANGINVTQNTDYILRFWYKMSGSGNRPIVNINSGSAFGTGIASGFPGNSTDWKEFTLLFNSGNNSKVWIRIFNNGGTVTASYDDFYLGLKQTPILQKYEPTWEHLDLLLDLARQYGHRIMLSLADNPTYKTKEIYIRWSDAIYGTTYFSRPSFNVTSAGKVGSTVSVITTTPHGYRTGNLITLTGPSISVTSITRTGSVATVTTSAPHNLTTGDRVTISGASQSEYNSSNSNTGGVTRNMGITVTSPTTFTYTVSGSPATPATGTITARWGSGDHNDGSYGNFITVLNSTTFTYQSSSTPPTSGITCQRSVDTQAFFDDANIRELYLDFFEELANRVNTINGRTYKNDDTISRIECGNELRYDQQQDPRINTVNSHNLLAMESWISYVTSQMQSIDTNHLIGFGDMAHTWQWVNGDTISNGTYTGVDYNRIIAIPSVDFGSFHLYPNQEGPMKKFGQRLGFPNAVTGDGFRAQLRDCVWACKNNNKPAYLDEVGFQREYIGSNEFYPLYPRENSFEDIFKVWFEAGGDGIMIWHGEIADAGSYSVNFTGTWDGTTTNLNWDDRKIARMIKNFNRQQQAPSALPTFFPVEV